MHVLVFTLVAAASPLLAGDDVPPAFSKTLPAHFLAPSTAAHIVLPGHAMAASPDEARAVLHEKALIVRAEADAVAAADVRRRAEDLSRRFLDDAATAGETSGTFETTSIAPILIAPAMSGLVASDAAVQRTDGPIGSVAMPMQTELMPAAPTSAHQPMTLEVEQPEAISRSDALAEALRKVAAAEARATAERRARLAAEAEAKAAVDRALEAIARADRATKSAAQKQAGVNAAAAGAPKGSAAARREASAAAKRGNPPPVPPAPEPSPSLLSKIFGGSKSSGSSGQPPSSPPPFALGVVQSIQN